MDVWEYAQQKAAADLRSAQAQANPIVTATGFVEVSTITGGPVTLAPNTLVVPKSYVDGLVSRIAELESENTHIRDMIARQSAHHCELVARYAELEAESARLLAAIAALQIEDAPAAPAFPLRAMKHSA